MPYQIETRLLPEQPTAVVEARLPATSLAGWLPGAYQEIAGLLSRTGTAPSGPPFARFSFSNGVADVQAGFPVPVPVPAAGRVTPSTLPAGPVAMTTHYGPYEQLVGAYQAVTDWLAEHGQRASGPHWEVYYSDPQTEPDPARWRTDVIAPYVPAGRPYVVLHNVSTLDGRTTGFPVDQGLYYEVAGSFPHQAVLTGSGTLLDAATADGIDVTGEDVEEPPAVALDDPRPWLVVVDGRGRLTRLNWLRTQPYWRDVLVLCHRATPPEHLDRLHRLRVGYLVAGAEHVDLADALRQLSERYGVRQIRVDAGGTLNGVLLRSGLVDEISVIVAPYLAGVDPSGSGHLVDQVGEAGTSHLVVASVRTLRDGHVWLRYTLGAPPAAPEPAARAAATVPTAGQPG